MAKEVTGTLKLVIEAGQAKPAPPVGPALGQRGIQIMEFCKQFNDKTKGMEGPIPCLITVYKDRCCSKKKNRYFILKAAV